MVAGEGQSQRHAHVYVARERVGRADGAVGAGEQTAHVEAGGAETTVGLHQSKSASDMPAVSMTTMSPFTWERVCTELTMMIRRGL